MGKRLGQHFLMHARIAERIVHVADLSKKDVVLEIGPGTGILTRSLLPRVKKVIAVEADPALFEKLRTEFSNTNLELIQGDIRAFDFTRLPKEYRVVANIPYYLTGDLLRSLLTSTNKPTSATLLVQKEVAERIARAKKESILSLSVKAYGTPKYEFTVPRGAFTPPPNVDSAVLSIRGISGKHFKTATAENRFFEYVRAGFAEKRKRLAKNLQKAGLFAPSSLENIRAEDLPLQDWISLSQKT